MLDSFWDGVKRLFSEPIPERAQALRHAVGCFEFSGNREAPIRYRNQARSLFEEFGEIELAEQQAKLLEEAQATTA